MVTFYRAMTRFILKRQRVKNISFAINYSIIYQIQSIKCRYFSVLFVSSLFSDMSKNPNLSKNSPATPAAPEPVAPGPRQHQRKNQQKKKKNNRF